MLLGRQGLETRMYPCCSHEASTRESDKASCVAPDTPSASCQPSEGRRKAMTCSILEESTRLQEEEQGA